MCSCWLVLWKILSTDRFWTRSDFLFSYMMRVMYHLDKRWICSTPKSSTASLWPPQIKDWLPQRSQRSVSAAGRQLHSCSALDLRARRAWSGSFDKRQEGTSLMYNARQLEGGCRNKRAGVKVTEVWQEAERSTLTGSCLLVVLFTNLKVIYSNWAEFGLH